ncbi:MAG: hypothetical protein ACK559_42355, partial [bacterium]
MRSYNGESGLPDPYGAQGRLLLGRSVQKPFYPSCPAPTAMVTHVAAPDPGDSIVKFGHYRGCTYRHVLEQG